jgi:hypothetical protein
MNRKTPAFLVGLIAVFGLLAAATHDASVASTAPTLRVILGAGAKGNLKPGVKRYPSGTKVQFSFIPTAGHAAAMVVLDGRLVKPKGTVTMNGDHYLWAFGNPESGKTFENVMTAPADVTKIPYPEFYQKAPSFSFNVADPYCAITSDVIAYPNSYLGAFPMPPIAGAPLPPDILRGVTLRDFWDTGGNPAQNIGCQGSYRSAFTASLKRLKRLGVDHVNMWQTAGLYDVEAAELRFVEDMRMSDDDLAWAVAEAKAAGLKYHNYMAVGGDTKGKPLPSNPDADWASRFLEAWTKFIVGRAVVAQRLGIEALQLDWCAYGWQMTPELVSVYVPKMTNLARRVRGVYSGKRFLGTSYAPSEPKLLKNIDWVHCPVNVWVPAEKNNHLSLSLLKRSAEDCLAWHAGKLGAEAPPVVWAILACSHPKALNGPWVEDSFCVPSREDCSQRKVRTDFSVQALAYEAMLEAINEQTLLKTASVEVMAYWFVDIVRPKDSFPNLSMSFRNKPAESIVYEWFKR